MKKLIALATTVLVATGMAFAAPVLNVHGFFGESLGAENTFAPNDAKRPVDDNWCLGAGAGLNFTINGTVGIQPEVNYNLNNIGYNVTTNTILNTTVETDTVFSYSSIDIPVFLTARFNKFNLAVGPYASIPVSDLTSSVYVATTTSSGTTTSEHEGSSFTISNKVIFGIAGGLEYEERTGVGRLTYGVRYMYDFTPSVQITTDKNGEKTSEQKLVTRRALFMSLGYKIAL